MLLLLLFYVACTAVNTTHFAVIPQDRRNFRDALAHLRMQMSVNIRIHGGITVCIDLLGGTRNWVRG